MESDAPVGQALAVGERPLQEMAAVSFYKYLFKRQKRLFFKSIFVAYLLPMLLEFMPWYMSRNRLLIRIRKARVSISYHVQSRNRLKKRVMGRFVLMAVLYSAIDTTVRFWRRRVRKEHKFAMRKLVMERMLYSEVESFEELKPKITKQLLSELSKSLDLFDTTIPGLVGSVYTLYVEGTELFRHRHRLDPLTILYPLALAVLRRTFANVRDMVLPSPKEMAKKQKIEKQWFNLVRTVSEGMTDIQVNNLQAAQLSKLSTISEKAITASKGFLNFFDQFYDYVSPRSILEFVGESYVVHTIMKRKNIAFNKHMVVQQDVEQCLRATKRIANLWQAAEEMLKRQTKVGRLLSLDTWEGELHEPQVHFSEFRELRMKDVQFHYGNWAPGDPLALDLGGEDLVFKPGTIYGIVGANEAGKSTIGKLLIKLHKPQRGTISLNGVNYDKIPRQILRQNIAYVSQRPYIFDGTIRENILVGNPHADEDTVIEAALAAGILGCQLETGAIESPLALKARQASKGRHRRSRSLGSAKFKPSLHGVGSFSDFGARGSYADIGKMSWIPPGVRISATKAEVQRVLDLSVGDKGQHLSGGLIQSVALARVFVHKAAKIVVLDEVTREMDLVKRGVVLPLLCEYIEQHNMTLIIITHDVSLMDDTDQVIVLNTDRKMTAQGQHTELVSSGNKAYAELLPVP